MGPVSNHSPSPSAGAPTPSGLDHLLFLLVVLATGWGLRQIGLALTAFTVGHAITLTASVFGVVRVSPAIVEPAIAATIVSMVLFDRWSQRRVATGAAPWPQGIRLGLVFGCALIHGLGLADALGGLGLDTASRLWSLAGFNIGIELAQLTVAVAAGALLWSWQRLHGLQGLVPAQQVGATLAAVVGSVWFVDRIFAMAQRHALSSALVSSMSFTQCYVNRTLTRVAAGKR